MTNEKTHALALLFAVIAAASAAGCSRDYLEVGYNTTTSTASASTASNSGGSGGTSSSSSSSGGSGGTSSNSGGSGGASSSSTSSSSGGSGGAPPVCTPTTSQPCYGGPPGTEGQGICTGGMQTCAADGMSWGPCVGEVVPKPEDCATPQDEDCDGLAPACKGNLLWARLFGKAGNERSVDLAVDAAGNVVITGYFDGSTDLGGGTMTSAGGSDLFVAKYDPSGAHIWSKRFGDVSDQVGLTVALDPSGNIVISGQFSGTLDFGNGPALASAGTSDVFVAKLDTSGATLWSKRYGDAGMQGGKGLAVDASGNLFLTGYFYGTTDFGDGSPLVSAGSEDVFVAKLDPSGATLWSKRFGGAGLQQGNDIAVDATGNVLVTGLFFGAMDLGGGPLTSAGNADVFVAKLDPGGAHVWSKRFGDPAYQEGRAIAVDGLGNVVMAGYFFGVLDVVGGSPMMSAGASDLFVTKLDPSGATLWGKRFGDGGNQQGQGVAVDASGNLLVTGYFDGTVDLGGGPLASAGGSDAFVAKLDLNGEHVWSKRFGSAGDQEGHAILADGSGNVLATGYVYGAVDFGGGTLTSAGQWDAFLAKFMP